MASSSLTTSAYFACKSKRLASWGRGSRSPTASAMTIGMNPYCMASTADARTHPLVERPTMTTVSTPRAVNVEARDVPKKALAYCL